MKCYKLYQYCWTCKLLKFDGLYNKTCSIQIKDIREILYLECKQKYSYETKSYTYIYFQYFKKIVIIYIYAITS